MNEAQKIVDELRRIAHAQEQMLIRWARIEACLDNLNNTMLHIKGRVGR